MNVAERIKALLDERQWSVYKLSQMSGVPHSIITSIFERNTSPTIPTLEAICKGFHIPLAQFFLLEEETCLVTPEERAVLKRWHSLSGAQREAFLVLLDSIVTGG